MTAMRVFRALSLSVVMCGAVAGVFPRAALAVQPNVIVVMTDDQGYGDLAAHGNPVLKTPNLDQLASQSIRLTDFHVAPMCTPTRGQLMSGRDALANGAMNVGSAGRSCVSRFQPWPIFSPMAATGRAFSENGI